MTLGSLFDGSGGFPLAGQLSGITPIWAAEVEPYPIAVTRSRFPHMMHLGSVTEVHGDKVQPVDVITFGSPCQDLSVAGKRAGIHDGQRSNLFFEAIRIIREMREATDGVYPAFAVWENVPGAFSSNQGEDFRCVLEEFVGISAEISVPRPAGGRWSQSGEIVGDGYSVAWRQLDAQYWGVPQRRKRIYLVADFAGERAGEILFERESLRGHPAACGAPGQGAAADAPGGTGGSRGARCLSPRVARTLTAEADASPCLDRGQNVVCVQNTGYGWWNQGDIAETLRTPVGGDSTKANLVVDCYDARGNGDGRHCPTLTGDHENCVTDYTAVTVYRSPKFGEYADDGTASTMAARDFKSSRDLVVEHENRVTDYTSIITYGGDKAGTLDASYYKGAGARNGKEREFVAERKVGHKYIIRRLTPLECCRLQGFPDGWGIPDHKDKLSDEELVFWQQVRDTSASIAGKPSRKYSAEALTKWYNSLHTDSAEYKMWGNGIALPCAAFVLAGIAEKLEGK